MKLTLDIPDDKAAFVLELLAHLPYIKTSRAKPTPRRPTSSAAPLQDMTDYLLASPANREHLLASIAEADRGEYFQRDLLD